ncbi:5-formyltetrahydrofolate cyclo-ligase [Accumulibacter sp.]|uniref:5-formyltetrahydrofolate cyclo-ligase n=1 Tax=Accumulibacter sp. TaxID=2053492 RepID=UPI00258D4412|nr:5-formyltetrahydrofolate cyclo-ligase [Accumulibacter sp.]
MLPVVIDEHRALAFRAWSPGTVMLADRYGIPAPAAGDFLIPQVLLIPVIGFDAAGYRIGYGGGYFDRTLASLCPRPLAIGVGFEIARLDSIRPGPHDQALDAMVTEAGIFRPVR